MSAAFNKLLLRAESAKHIMNTVCAASAVHDEETFGAIEAEYLLAQQELKDCMTAVLGFDAERVLEALS